MSSLRLFYDFSIFLSLLMRLCISELSLSMSFLASCSASSLALRYLETEELAAFDVRRTRAFCLGCGLLKPLTLRFPS